MARLQTANRRRSGVILLVVVILLTLFMVLGLSFVQYSESEASASRIFRESQTITDDRADVDPKQLLNWSLGQLIYDVRDDGEGLYSALRGHSLARNMYGWNYQYVGASTFDPNFYSSMPWIANQIPFNGVGPLNTSGGFGYKNSQLVNFTYYATDGAIRDPERLGSRKNAASAPGAFAGGANVPYTFPDNANMFLAAIKANGSGGTPQVLMPSFFRPIQLASGQVVRDLSPNNSFWTDPNPAYKYLTLRPRPADHYYNPSDPSGSFPLPADAGGDVSNLSGATGFAGGNDSFWIDLNYPVQTTKTGKKYKPLFAILVTDLDNRINLNAHGNIRAGAAGNEQHASNMGLSASEVNVSAVLNANPTEWRQVFRTNNPNFPGRYGTDGLPGVSGASYPDFPVSFRRSTVSRIDYDGVDETSGNQISQPLMLPAAYHLFPDFVNASSGFDDLRTTQSRQRHPLLYHPISPNDSDSHFRMDENLYYLHGSVSGNNYRRAKLFNNLPVNLTSAARRMMLTTHSYDLDVPGMTPWLSFQNGQSDYQLNIDPAEPIYKYIPKGNQQNFAGSNAWTSPPSNLGDYRSQFLPSLNLGGQAPLLSRIDMNRRLTSYFNAAGQFDPNQAVDTPGTAQYDRQQFATDIFIRLILATGADKNAMPGTPQYDALRWLAQLSANIVDYIDDDDIMTAFNWRKALGVMSLPPAETDFVYGTEASRVLLNEVYAEIRNAPGDDNAMLGATQPFQVNFFLELFNPLPITNQPDVNLAGQDRNAAMLRNPANNADIYQIDIVDESQAAPTTLHDASNILGIPRKTDGTNATAKCSVTSFSGTAAGDANFILPNPGQAKGVPGSNQGFYVVTANENPESGSDLQPTLKVTSGLTFNVPAAETVPVQPQMTILVRRLANPYLAPQPNAGAPNYNPYVTVDYQENVKITDAVKYGTNPNPTVPLTPRPEHSQQRSSKGREQPFTGIPAKSVAQSGMTWHTFFNHNSNSNNGQFDWLVHLDRPLASVMELLQVNGYKPFELTQQFVDPAGLKFMHRAPWMYGKARIYRALEFFTVGDRNLPGSTASLANTRVSTGGRKAGLLNINTIWDREVFNALCDPQSSDNFTQTEVDAAWNAIQQRRLQMLGGTGTVDVPFLSLASPDVPGGDTQFDPNNQNKNGPMAGFLNTFVGPQGATNPAIKDEILAKVAGRITTRSNVFEVYITVGFFEVMDDTVRPVKLGAEVRTRDGSFVRHKMFAVVDRTNLAMDDTDPFKVPRDANDTTQAKRPIFMTTDDPIARGATTVTVAISGGVPKIYDPSYPSPDTVGILKPRTTVYVDTGIGREQARIVSVTATQLQLQFTGGAQYDHPPGTTISTIRTGNPGPQSDFDVAKPVFKFVVPYSKVIQ